MKKFKKTKIVLIIALFSIVLFAPIIPNNNIEAEAANGTTYGYKCKSCGFHVVGNKALAQRHANRYKHSLTSYIYSMMA